jgi:hypothetical protein
MEDLKDVNSMQEFDLHLPNEALPIQVKQNKSVVGKISLSNFPTGSRNDYGGASNQNTEFEITVSNSQQMLLTNSAICCDVTLLNEKDQDGVATKFRGGQTAFKSFSVTINNKKLVDLQNHADKVADFHISATNTTDQLKQLESITGYNVPISNNKTISLRIPLKWFGLEIGNLIPTGTIGTTLRINATINTDPVSQLSRNDPVTGTKINLKYNNFRLESEFVELQPMLLSKRIERISSSTGLVIPYHTYAVDVRNLSQISSFNERIALNYNNIVALYQLPYNTLKEQPLLYTNLLWGASTGDNTINIEQVKDYLVNFDGSQYYNLNSNGGQSGKAAHAQALLNSTRCEFCPPGAGESIISNLDTYQALGCDFVRSNNVLSPAIIDSGVNARMQSGIINTQCSFNTAIAANKQLVTIIKFTRRLIMKNKSMDVFS